MQSFYLFLSPSTYSSKFFNTYISILKSQGARYAHITNIYSLLRLVKQFTSRPTLSSSLIIFFVHLLYLLSLVFRWLLTGRLSSCNPQNSYELDIFTLLDDEYIALISSLLFKNKRISYFSFPFLVLFAFVRCIIYLSLVRVFSLFSFNFVCCTNERIGIKNAIISTLSEYSIGSTSIVEFSLGNCQLNRPRSTHCVYHHHPEVLTYQPQSYVQYLDIENTFYTYKNIVFLHIFGDSSCHVFTSNRLYRNYFQWLKSLISHISQSKQQWIFRFHPNAFSWGENSSNILRFLFPRLTSLKNIVFDFGHDEINFTKGDRVVTFNGTIADELAPKGIRVITYELTQVEQFQTASTIHLNSYSLEEYYLSDSVDRNLLVLNSEFSSKLESSSVSLFSQPPPSLLTYVSNAHASYVNDSNFTDSQLRVYYDFLLDL